MHVHIKVREWEDFKFRMERVRLAMDSPPVPRKRLSHAVNGLRPTVADLAQYLMAGNPVERSAMIRVRLVESRNDWPLAAILISVERELRRYGFVLECQSDVYTARSYRR